MSEEEIKQTGPARFQIDGNVYVMPRLGMRQLKIIAEDVRRLGYDSFHDLLVGGVEKLFMTDAIYFFVSCLLHPEEMSAKQAFERKAIEERRKQFEQVDLDPACVGECISFFFTSLTKLAGSSPLTLALLERKNNPAASKKKSSQKKKKRTGRRSSKTSKSSSPKATSFGIVASKEKTSRSG